MKFRGSPPTHTHTLPDLLERKAALLFLLRHLHRCCCFGGHMSALPSENYTAAVHYFWSSGRRREVWALVEGGTCWKVLQHTPACGPMVERHHMVLKNNWDPSSLPLLFFLCVWRRQFKADWESRSAVGGSKGKGLCSSLLFLHDRPFVCIESNRLPGRCCRCCCCCMPMRSTQQAHHGDSCRTASSTSTSLSSLSHNRSIVCYVKQSCYMQRHRRKDRLLSTTENYKYQ